MTDFNARLAERIQLCAALFACAVSAGAQSVCNTVDATTFCQGTQGSSTMNQVGDFTYVSRSDGSNAIHQRIGDTTIITDSREGMSGFAQHMGETMIINLTTSSSVCNKLGSTMWCS